VVDAGIVFAQREATLNMLAAVFATAEACLRRAARDRALPQFTSPA